MTDKDLPLTPDEIQGIRDRAELESDPDYLDGAGSLGSEIAALNVMLGEQVPEIHDSIARLENSIDDLERSSVTHRESKRRTIRSISFVLLVGLAAILGSIYLVLGVAVPKCFLATDIAKASSSCDYIPNFQRTQRQDVALNEELTSAEKALYNEIQQSRIRQVSNTDRINQLQQEIATLDKDLGKPVPKQIPAPPLNPNPLPKPTASVVTP